MTGRSQSDAELESGTVSEPTNSRGSGVGHATESERAAGSGLTAGRDASNNGRSASRGRGNRSGGRLITGLTYALAAGFYISLWGGVLVLTGAAVWFAQTGAATLPGVPDWALAGWCAFTALFVVVAQFVTRTRRSAGRVLERAAAPEFFRLIDDVRREVNAPPVREVRLKPSPVLGVTRLWRRERLLVREHKVLVIGLPFFRAFSVEELRGAIAHELAHFVAGDVRRRSVVNAALSRIGLMRSILERGRWFLTWFNPLWWFLRAYGMLFRRAVGAIRRSQECVADATGARVAGAHTYAHTLIQGAVLGIGFRRLALGILVRARRDGRRVENFYAEFATVMDGLSPLSRDRAVQQAFREQASPLDEHPALQTRVARLGFEEPPAREFKGPSASSLIPGLDDLERAMTPLALAGLALGLGERLRRRMAHDPGESSDPF